MEDKLRAAALAVSSAEGEKIYESLVGSLASILGVEFALIAVYVDAERTLLRTLATMFEGRIVRNIDYPIAGTPCERAMGRAFGLFPSGVRAQFPLDKVLADQRIEGYAASTLNDNAGEPTGLVVAMSRRPLENEPVLEAVLKIFATRISAEIERRRSEAVLRASEEQYRAIFNATTDALMLRDEEFRIVDINPAWEKMSGYARADVVGMDRPVFSDDSKVAERREMHARALAGEHVRFEVRGKSKEGDREFLREVRLLPIQFRGKPHVLQIGTDITERKAAEEQLRASEEHYRAIFDATADSLVLRDAEFRIVDVNPAYEQMSGRPRAEAIGRQDVTMSNPERTARIRAMHERALAGEVVSWETDARRKNGAAFDIDVRGVPIRHRGQPHVLYIGRDITQRKQLEAQLRQAQKMEAIGHLAGGVAHDFNNILQGILGNLTLAAERQAELGDTRLGRYLERAQHSARRGRELIAQMLTFSRGQRGERRSTSLVRLVHDACKLLRPTLPASIDLRLSLDEDLPALPLDPVQVEQVVVNLCINARDAMRGTGAIRIGLRKPARIQGICASCRQKVDGRYVELFVRDTGPGIAPQVMERMFEPFYSTKETGRGSGMGLSMAHGIVHEHGGHILVDSVQNERTKFRVLLEAPTEASSEAPAVDTTVPPKRLKARLSGRVLLAEDEPVIREFMADLLSGWGLEVDAHGDGAAARGALAADPARYDIVIADHSMPILTGLELAREAARLRPGLPVVLYTGYGEELSPKMLSDAGVAELVRKPIEPAQFFPLLAARLRSA